MGIYLVMKNNVKRIFATKSIYLQVLLIPIAISFISSIFSSFTNTEIRVGIICKEEEYRQVSDIFMAMPGIHYEWAESASKHTDLILGKYQYMVDITNKEKVTAEKEIKENMTVIMAAAKQRQQRQVEGLSLTDRTFALLLTVYMIIGSMYATTIIRDKKNKTMERFCYAGSTKTAYSLGSVASTSLLLLYQLSLVVLILTVFNKSFSVSIGRATVLIVYMTAISSIFGVCIAYFQQSELRANIMASSIVAILSLLGGTFIPISQMPHILKYISILSPIRWLQYF